MNSLEGQKDSVMSEYVNGGAELNENECFALKWMIKSLNLDGENDCLKEELYLIILRFISRFYRENGRRPSRTDGEQCIKFTHNDEDFYFNFTFGL